MECSNTGVAIATGMLRSRIKKHLHVVEFRSCLLCTVAVQSWLLNNILIVLLILGVVVVVVVAIIGCCSSTLCFLDLPVGVLLDGFPQY